ncbi:hypothetical protein Y032_0084g1749 [Ancylostoma ceylanicum]|uniref:Uncharacterized protein n=1 Tax=Ancylostoma ceylanicum TaxID=53326 RepID=A0A016TPY6_9BILA|nr:hypothetical protein Y032_0084g1749 [Ancylostoma ceylanicum]
MVTLILNNDVIVLHLGPNLGKNSSSTKTFPGFDLRSDEGENAETLAVIKIDTSLGLPLNIINFYQQRSCQDFKKVELGHCTVHLPLSGGYYGIPTEELL